jgi:tryptophan synthase beta subunit
MDEVSDAFFKLKDDPKFLEELHELYKDFV